MGMNEADHDWCSYQSRLWHWNEQHDPKSNKPAPDLDGLRRFMSVH